jgi:hypothetical protein
MKAKVISWMVIAFGVLLVIYGTIGVSRYGFYISGRWSIGQIEGGVAPFFILIGFLAVAYGVIQLKLGD